MLESINGVALDADGPGNTGCNRFSGLVALPLESGDVLLIFGLRDWVN